VADKLSAEGLKAAADFTKQVITLSTGVITLTVTFLEKIIQPTAGVSRPVPVTMFSAWVFFGIAVIAGVATLGAIAGTLEALDRQQNKMPLSDVQNVAVAALGSGANVIWPARVMAICFLLGMLCTIATGFVQLKGG